MNETIKSLLNQVGERPPTEIAFVRVEAGKYACIIDLYRAHRQRRQAFVGEGATPDEALKEAYSQWADAETVAYGRTT